MFGYRFEEVRGRNIKALMPQKFAIGHDKYLSDYLATGVKHVIGIGRRVTGLKKDGTEFPLHLSISEVKEDGEHFFTGIARDMTQEVEREERHAAAELSKKQELESLIDQLDIAKEKSDNLLEQMLPPVVSAQLLAGKTVEPQSFECATVFFMDVVGFTTIASQIPALEIVSLLNELYKIIDDVIAKYDVYKVETIGDSYMIVSGVPEVNHTHAPGTKIWHS